MFGTKTLFYLYPPSCPAKLVVSMEAFNSPQAQFINLAFLSLYLMNLLILSKFCHHHFSNNHYQKLKMNYLKIIRLESQENLQLVSLHLLHIVIHTARLLKYQYCFRSVVRCPSFCSSSPKPSPKSEGIRPTTACWSCCLIVCASCGRRPLLDSCGLCSASVKRFHQLGTATRDPECDAKLGQKGQTTIYGPR